jgi:peroxiredoxin-like protein
MSDIHLYDVDLKWTDTRKGVMSSAILNETIEVATPPEFTKGITGVWSPEHLFVAAINSCLMTTFLAIAENSKLEFTGFTCSSTGKLEKVNGKFIIAEVILRPVITLKSENDRERAERIIAKAEAECFISNSAKSKITLQPAFRSEPSGIAH